jgi:hypothetical protein
MGEFGAVSVISGNILGKTQTLTLFVESAYKVGREKRSWLTTQHHSSFKGGLREWVWERERERAWGMGAGRGATAEAMRYPGILTAAQPSTCV